MKINIFSVLTFFCLITLIGVSGSAAFGQEVNVALPANNPKVTAKGSEPWAVWETPDDLKIKRRVGGPAEKAIDGVKSGNLTLWDQTIVETAGNDGWLEVDLGDYYNISKIVIYPRNDTCCLDGFKPILIVTDQPLEKKPMLDDAKISYSSAYFKYFNSPIKSNTTENIGKIGRYVRLQMKGSDRVELAEIEIYGDKTAVAGHKPDPGKAWNASVAANNSVPENASNSPASTKDLTKNPGVKASQSTPNSYTKTPAQNAIDGKDDTFSETDSQDGWFEVDLGDYYTIEEIKIHPRKDCCVQMFNATYVIVSDHPIGNKAMLDSSRIGYSSNNFNFYEPLFVDKDTQVKTINTNKSKGRYVRLQIKGGGAIELSEIQIFGEKAQNYTANNGKKWDAAFVAPFDPNYPDFRGAKDEYLSTLQHSPKIVGVKNSATSFDIAFQDNFGDSKLIKVNTYEKDGAGFKKNTAKSMNLTGLGVFGGFAKEGKDRYVFTGTPWTARGEPGISRVYRNNEETNKTEEFWNGQFYNPAPYPKRPPYTGNIESFMHFGGSRLVAGKNTLLITTNIAPAHPYQVILDTQDASKNSNRVFFESLNQHNYGQRALFDGTDFVVMENRDHDVSVTLSKLSPSEVFPLSGKNEDHALEYVKKIFRFIHTPILLMTHFSN